jgi:hypothetical protein
MNFNKIIWCHSENNLPYYLKGIPFVKCVPDFENPASKSTLILLDNLMYSACSKKASELFTKGTHLSNVSLIPITQNYFPYSKCKTVFKNRQYESPFVCWSVTCTLKINAVFTQPHLSASQEPHSYLFVDLSEAANDSLRFRNKILPGKISEERALFGSCNKVDEVSDRYCHVLKTASRKIWRSLILSADDKLVKALLECMLNTLNGNPKAKPNLRLTCAL